MASLLLLFCALIVTGVGAQTLSEFPTTAYVVQETCFDRSGKALPIDPYYCPYGDKLRPVEIGEPLPYHKHDQPAPDHPDGYQQHDSYPVRDSGGNLLIVNPFDYKPFDHFKPWEDGYDIYRMKDGWVSVGETKDGGGFSTTFFGADCMSYNGWAFFPASVVETPRSGRIEMPIHGDYWEHNGESWPGACPSSYQTNSLTTWDFVRGFPFGGIGGNPVKPLDAIRSIHGFSTNSQFLAHGHLEVFYFTKLYGATRWEVWTPRVRIEADDQLQQQAAQAATRCSGAGDVEYEGQQFAVTACHDWSAVSVSTSPSTPTAWPIPDLNFLRNFHFGSDFSNWSHSESSPGIVTLSLKNSTDAKDVRFVQPGGQGVRYVALACTGKCSVEDALYQDVPVSGEVTSGIYTFGATARFEGNSAGILRFVLSQLDSSGTVLGEKSFTAIVWPSNAHFAGAESVVLSSGFVSQTDPVTIDPRAHSLRFSISPATAGTFDIVDTWVMKSSYWRVNK